MVEGNLVKLENQIKWTLQTYGASYDITKLSESFEIQGRKCNFLFDYGCNPERPISLSMKFEGKEKFNSSLDVLILVSSTPKVLSHERHHVTGEQKQIIWSSIDFTLRGSFFTFDMIIWNILKDNKSTQTPSYIDNCFLMDSLSKDFSKLLEEDMNHDVEFTCRDQIIKAHKSVICSRSSVFASMLHSDMVEGKTGRVNIEDMEATIFEQFLKCLYTGVMPKLTLHNALEFYNAGDKYNIEALKKQCSEFLEDNLSPVNACDILIVADLHSDQDFKKDIINYIMKNKIPIIGENWPDFCKGNPVLANEVLNLFCQYLNSK